MYTYSCSERTDCATTAILYKQSWLFRFWKPKPSVWGWSNWGAPQNLTDVRKKLFGESWQRFSEHDVLLLNASKGDVAKVLRRTVSASPFFYTLFWLFHLVVNSFAF